MNSEQFKILFETIVSRSRSVMIDKAKEYANDNDRFYNFNNAKNFTLAKTNVGAAWEFLCKHLQSVKDIVSEIDAGNWSRITEKLLDEKFADCFNYFILIEGMIREELDRKAGIEDIRVDAILTDSKLQPSNYINKEDLNTQEFCEEILDKSPYKINPDIKIQLQNYIDKKCQFMSVISKDRLTSEAIEYHKKLVTK